MDTLQGEGQHPAVREFSSPAWREIHPCQILDSIYLSLPAGSSHDGKKMLCRLGINIDLEWSNHKWTVLGSGGNTTKMHWDHFQRWSEMHMTTFCQQCVHTCPGPRWRSTYSTDILCETRRQSHNHTACLGSLKMPKSAADVCEQTVCIKQANHWTY